MMERQSYAVALPRSPSSSVLTVDRGSPSSPASTETRVHEYRYVLDLWEHLGLGLNLSRCLVPCLAHDSLGLCRITLEH